MPRYAEPPPPLAAAISQASVDKKVPADLLVGIWHVESASTYPNPAVNSLGYGGLFGTHDWNGPTQEQADLAASILHNLLVSHHGNVAQALSDYSGGGYTQVPGERSFGTVNVGTQIVSEKPGSSSGDGSSSPHGFWGHLIPPFLGGGASNTGNPAGVPTPGSGILTGWISDLFNLAKSFALRIALVVGGFLLGLLALFILSGRSLPAVPV